MPGASDLASFPRWKSSSTFPVGGVMGTVTALLGPTNTGKTHRAVRRMLGHRTGMIGLPLRLLAREVYDRVSAEVGEEAVALVTGEERRVPRAPRYWVCTVESMPLDRPVDFVAVDEIQLAAHRERGHVFTDRLLRARGWRETWLLGSDTMTGMLQALVPTAVIEGHPRLSRLRHGPPVRLSTLPERSAVVAFSAERVYELAGRLRARRGGTAVVLGALSPRTRNAQVAMYQSGEVQFLVATDAIGMGLNLDVGHVALADLSKFDGFEHRPLTEAGLAQVAGRAGRFTRDGSFGVLEPLDDLDPRTVDALETHRFPPITRVVWRNTDLDFGSLDALQASLREPPPRPCLRALERADDTDALAVLARRPDLVAAASGPDRVRLLWEVCQVPDFRQTLEGSHARLLGEVFRSLLDGQIDPRWLDEQVGRLDRVDGDIDSLVTRIAWMRTWTYIAHRHDWVPDAPSWQRRTRDVEDRLSDALHESLTRSFVDRRAMVLIERMERPGALEAEVDAEGRVTAAGEPLGRLVGFDFFAATHRPEDARTLRRAARQALDGEIQRRVGRIAEAPHEAFALDDDSRIGWEGAPIARLVAGPEVGRPDVRLFQHDLLPGGGRARVHRRLQAWVRDAVGRLFASLEEEDGLGVPARSIAYAVARGLGTVERGAVAEPLAALSARDRRALARLDVRVGAGFVYAARLLAPDAVSWRAALWATFHGLARPPLPTPEAASLPAEGAPDVYFVAIGFPACGPRAVRVDLLETAAARLRGLGPRFRLPGDLGQRLGCSREELDAVVIGMGYRALGEGRFAAGR